MASEAACSRPTPAVGTQQIIGLTVINARQVLKRDERLIVTVPETVETSADDLAPALHAA